MASGPMGGQGGALRRQPCPLVDASKIAGWREGPEGLRWPACSFTGEDGNGWLVERVGVCLPAAWRVGC
jgi:hypothetical protein